VDTWVASGTTITPSFDSLIAKVMVHASSRTEAVQRMAKVLGKMRVKGIPTNAQLCQAVLENEEFVGGSYDTHVLTRVTLQPSFAEVCLDIHDINNRIRRVVQPALLNQPCSTSLAQPALLIH
jgi:urea carboxylase